MEIIREKEEQIRGLLEEGKTNHCSRLLFFPSGEAVQLRLFEVLLLCPTSHKVAQVAHEVLNEESA